jgi:hypothetical protein
VLDRYFGEDEGASIALGFVADDILKALRLQSGTYSEPFDSSGAPIGADVAARRAAAQEGTQFFEEWLAALPDYFHGFTVEDMRDLFRFMPCVHQVRRSPKCPACGYVESHDPNCPAPETREDL